MSKFDYTTRVTRIPKNSGTITSRTSLKSRLKFMMDEGKEIIAETYESVEKNYNRRAPRDTGRSARGFQNNHVSRQWGNLYYRESITNKVPYAGYVEHGVHKSHARSGTAYKIFKPAKTQARKEFKNRVISELNKP